MNVECRLVGERGCPARRGTRGLTTQEQWGRNDGDGAEWRLLLDAARRNYRRQFAFTQSNPKPYFNYAEDRGAPARGPSCCQPAGTGREGQRVCFAWGAHSSVGRVPCTALQNAVRRTANQQVLAGRVSLGGGACSSVVLAGLGWVACSPVGWVGRVSGHSARCVGRGGFRGALLGGCCGTQLGVLGGAG